MEGNYYDTVNSRTILIPELGLPFRIISIEPDAEIRTALRALDSNIPAGPKGPDLDGLLEAEASLIFGVPSSQVTSFDRWAQITNAIEATFTSERFKREMVSAYGGDELATQRRMEEWIDDNKTTLSQWKNQFSTASAFSETLIRKGILDPLHANPRATIHFLNYTGEPTLLQSVYGELAEHGILDTELINWQRATNVLGRSILPSSKRAFELIQQYELPIPGSPNLTKLTLETFIRSCRGAAYVTLGSTAVHAAGAVAGPTSVLALIMFNGVIASLTFIATGQVAEFIEKRLFGRKRASR